MDILAVILGIFVLGLLLTGIESRTRQEAQVAAQVAHRPAPKRQMPTRAPRATLVIVDREPLRPAHRRPFPHC